ncbi:FAD-dependent oxidoreductase [Terrabacter sp. Soil811]|uniref:phytoene desaturase family protein n=1 Tax=Terrabacter sp. Soil811 TaxID=1736419 RepID=UPI0006F6C3F3|nr:NAD(P)/FAD-dependent oxidoreductase [Terrabacter sp. Soil811]KRF47752.1 FAD-dependent oxidoreductase [Terrabacter sp. Soil811]
MTTTDAVVIGSGPNGLVAANLLVDAGWSVVVLEEQDRPGGAVSSDDAVAPGHVHDTFSSFYPLAAASPTIRGLRLEEHGLEWSHAPSVLGHSFGDGRWGVLHRDRAATASALDEDAPGDGEAWLALCETWDRVGDDVLRGLLSPFPPVRGGAGLARQVLRPGGLELLREMTMPARSLTERLFRGEAARMLVAGNAGHADIGLESPGSAAMGLLLALLGQSVGFPVPRGGAGRLATAMVGRLESQGGELCLGERAEGVRVQGGRAVAVRTASREIHVRRAVLADVSAPALYGGLVPWGVLPSRLRHRMARFEWDPSTVKVDWALDGPVPWQGAPAAAPGTVHVADSMDEMTLTGGQVAAGLVPDKPFLLVGQMGVADASRVPTGGEALWAYTHVPQRVRGDAAAGRPRVREVRGTWDEGDLEAMAERIEQRIEDRAPGFRDRITARRVLGPRELEARDANLVGGAINGGTAGLQQQLVFRPVAGSGRAETPVKGLYLASASAHPGGGVHGACGANAARAALWHHKIQLPWRRT